MSQTNYCIEEGFHTPVPPWCLGKIEFAYLLTGPQINSARNSLTGFGRQLRLRQRCFGRCRHVCNLYFCLSSLWTLYCIYSGNIKTYFHFTFFSRVRTHWVLKSCTMRDNVLLIIHRQYHGCWWLGDAMGQAISNHVNGLVLPKYPSLGTRVVMVERCLIQALYLYHL